MNLERYWCHLWHAHHIPLLIDPQLLRRIGAGQIDGACIKKSKDEQWIIHLLEVKTSQFPSTRQMRRLRESQKYLATLFQVNCKLWLAQGKRLICQN